LHQMLFVSMEFIFGCKWVSEKKKLLYEIKRNIFFIKIIVCGERALIDLLDEEEEKRSLDHCRKGSFNLCVPHYHHVQVSRLLFYLLHFNAFRSLLNRNARKYN
jgi:hypothetical protein